MPVTRTSVLTATVVAAALAVPASASAAPTITPDRQCYSPGDDFTLSGSGFAASAPVKLSIDGRRPLHADLTSDALGTFTSRIAVEQPLVDALLRDDEGYARVALSATDAPTDPAVAPGTATSSTLISRWGTFWNQDGDAIRPSRPLEMQVFGFTGSAGRSLYLHYVRAGRRAATVKLGRLQGPCGVLHTTLRQAMPRRIVKPGKWRFAFTLKATDHRAAPGYSYTVTVKP